MKKTIISILLASGVVFWLVFSATGSSARQVVTVAELDAEKKDKSRMQLGAQVVDGSISYRALPSPMLAFRVKDRNSNGPQVNVRFDDIMPDSLMEGRDVILQGKYVDGIFYASTLLTQCPSKYEPLVPTETTK